MEIVLELLLEVVLALLFNGPFVRGFRKGLDDDEENESDSPEAQAQPRRKAVSPVLLLLFYVVVGACSGWASLAFTPEHMLQNKMASYINLAASPIIAGLIMMAIGARLKNRPSVFNLDLFFYGYIFALTFSLVRFVLAYDLI